MHIFILGMGHVGKALASQLRAAGHRVTGSTTTPDKVEGLQAHADEVVVLRGAETDKLKKAASDCDAIVVTVAPDVKKTRTRRGASRTLPRCTGAQKYEPEWKV